MNLLPCPFCGTLAVVEYCGPIDDERLGYQVRCPNARCPVDNPVAFGDTEESAIAAWNTRDDRWTSVEDRLPEDRKAKLVWCPERRNTYCACYEADNEEGKWFIFGGWRGESLEKIEPVTHWRPLPEPPKEVQ